MGGVSGDKQGALWPQLCTQSAQLYLYTRTAAWLRTSHFWDGYCPPALNSRKSCDGHHSPLRVHVHVCMAQGSLRHMQSAAGKALPNWYQVG